MRRRGQVTRRGKCALFSYSSSLDASHLAGVGSCQAYQRGAERHGSGQRLQQRRLYQLQPHRQPALRRSRGRMGRHFSRASAELRQRPCRTAHQRVARQTADGSGGLLRRNRTATAKFRRAGLGHLAGIPAIRMVQSRAGWFHQGRPGPRQSSGRQSPAGRQGAPPAGGKKRPAAPPRRRAGRSVLSRGSRVRALAGSSARSERRRPPRVSCPRGRCRTGPFPIARSDGRVGRRRSGCFAQLPPPTRCFWPGPPAT